MQLAAVLGSGRAGVAEAAQLNLDGELSNALRNFGSVRTDLQRHAREARDGAAVRAHEVRVVPFVARAGSALFQRKTPHVVAEIGPRDDSRVREVRQVPVDGRAIVALA